MRTYTPQSSSTNTACKMRAPHLHKLSCVSVQKQTICKMSVHGLTCCSIIDDSHKAKYVHQHTYTIFTEAREGEHTHKHLIYRESAHTHTHTNLEREHAHTIYFTGEETMHKTFLCSHTHHNHQPRIQNAKCVCLTFFNHCCISSAAFKFLIEKTPRIFIGNTFCGIT
jgi:hypothetical protein